MVKTCNKCNVEKPLDQFNVKKHPKNPDHPGWHHNQCKDCAKKHKAEWYRKNNEKRLSYAKKYYEDNREEIIESSRQKRFRHELFVWEYLTAHPCQHCGESNPLVLEFHHIDRDSKAGNISQMAFQRIPTNHLQSEIDKCEVLCANCHRIETTKINNGPRWKLYEEYIKESS